MAIRGIRGAINLRRNTRPEIFAKTQELLQAMISANRLKAEDVAAAFFTMTSDLHADFPAHAARRLGWDRVPMLCAREIAVPGAMKRVVRILLLTNADRSAARIRHQYLGDTPCLRPDLVKTPRKKKARRLSRRNSASMRIFAGDTP